MEAENPGIPGKTDCPTTGGVEDVHSTQLFLLERGQHNIEKRHMDAKCLPSACMTRNYLLGFMGRNNKEGLQVR